MLRNIIVKPQINLHKSYVTKELSSASKSLNIFKNKQNAKYIKESCHSMFNPQEKLLIRRFLKADNIDMKHLNDLKTAFLSCETSKLGYIKKKDYLMKIYNMNLKFPQ